MEKDEYRGKRRIPRKKGEFRGKFRGSGRLVKTQIPRLGSKFHGPRKTVGPTDYKYSMNGWSQVITKSNLTARQ